MKLQWRQILLLGRTFFGRLFESDLMPPGLPQVQLIIVAMVLLGTPAMIMPVSKAGNYAFLWFTPGLLERAIVRDRLILITFAMVTMGFLSLVMWEGVFPDRRDARTLGSLPVTNVTFVLARLGALFAMFCLFIAGTQLIGGVLFGIVAASFGSPGGVVGNVGGHLVATISASAFSFFSIIAMQCVLLCVLGRVAVQRAAVVLQIVFGVLLIEMVFFLPQVGKGLGDGNLKPDWMSSADARLVPSVWFLALYEWLTGFGGRGIYPMAWPALTVTIAVVGLTVALYAATYGRLVRRALETPAGVRTRGEALERARGHIAGWLPGSNVCRAVRAFTLRTLARSRQHRMLLCLYAAMGVALVFSAVLPLLLRRDPEFFAKPSVALTSAPLVLMFFLLCGMRAIFAIPVEPKANWPFRLREPPQRHQVIAGVRSAMIRSCVLPIAIAAGLSVGIPWTARLGAAHALFCLLMGTLLVELLLIGMCKVPFTCTYFPGKARLTTLWPAYLVAFTTYAYTAGALEADILLYSRTAYLWVCSLLATAIVAMEIRRRFALRNVPGLLFEEVDPNAMFTGFSLSEGLAANSRPAP